MTLTRTIRRFLVSMVTLALLAGAGYWTVRHVGRWLVVSDPLQHARAIVVLGGSMPFRAMEAAAIYRQGWAPEVWLFREKTDAAVKTLAQLGIHLTPEEEYNQQVLERLGVPQDAIRILEPPTTNTVSEVTLIAGELRREGADKAIVVTSPVHTRRTKAIWRILVGDHPQALLRADTFEPSDPDHWWRTTNDVEAVVHELLGLINTHLGFVAKPR